MSEPLASYAFLPWLRRGVGTEISRVDGGGTPAPHATVPIGVRFNRDDALSGAVALELVGPGEVKTLDSRAVLRVWPRPGVMNAEPNYFPLIELDQADLAWRYTAARATPGERLTPWLALIVLTDSEAKFVPPAEPTEGEPVLGRVEVADQRVLPRHDQLWAWAHLQVSGVTTITEDDAARLLAAEPHRLRARLIAPRRLAPGRAYTAFLVPSFRRGALTGLGEETPDAVDALEPAWDASAGGPMTLPVYYHWRFGTGPAGDFESLARLIRPFTAPPTVGVRDMDVSAASPGFAPAHPAPMGLRGMLTGLSAPDTSWDPAARLTWIGRLKQLLNLPLERLRAGTGARTVVPPLYGQWHAATDRCAADEPAPRPAWFQDLNVDPRLRVGAALGTQVVQEQQEALMASAWQQVDRIRELNEELRRVQLAREVAVRLHERHVAAPDPALVLSLTAPVHAKMRASPTTVRAVLRQSPIPAGVLDGPFRRISRPRGPIGRRLRQYAGPPRPALLDRLNRGELSAAPPPKTPPELATPATTGGGLAPQGVSGEGVASRQRLALAVLWVAFLLLLVALFLLASGLGAAAGVVGVIAAVSGALALRLRRRLRDLARRVAWRDGRLRGDDVRAAGPTPGFVPTEAPPGGPPPTLPTAPAGTTPPAWLVPAFGQALAQMVDRIARPGTPGPILRSVDLPALRAGVLERLDPRTTIAQAYQGRYQLAPGVHWQPEDPIEPILAAPEFPQPMYRELAKLSPEWLLPGASEIPGNSAVLLRTNQKMIEAFMVGLNHEMSRELLWREYPGDQRGTYFRQFWDVAGHVPPAGESVDPARLKDITPIHTWPKPSVLGTHSPRAPMPGGDYLVLLVKGDLLRRYPRTLVYAVRARWIPEGLREIDDPTSTDTPAQVAAKERWPVFSGFLEPDATFFGFELTVPEAQGSASPAGDPGWFFVFQEPVDEPRFGLDEANDGPFGVAPVGTWNDLSWAHLAADAAALDAMSTIDLDADLPDTTRITDAITRRWHANRGTGQTGSRASDLAYITFQRPMRVGIHGADMIPR